MADRPFLGLVALGPVDPNILQRLRPAIAKRFGLPVRVLPPAPLPPHTFHVVRNQHHSTQLLEYLLREGDSQAFRILGVTTVDLYIPILTFVFGEAQVDGKAAVISLFRPRGDADGVETALPVLLRRLVKLGIHELGHTFGLGHCREDGCLMAFAPNLERLDEKDLEFCRYCQVLLTDYFRDKGIKNRSGGFGETPAPGGPSPTGDSGRKRRR